MTHPAYWKLHNWRLVMNIQWRPLVNNISVCWKQKHSFLEFCIFFHFSNFNIQHSAYSVTVFSFTRGRHDHKFEIFTITVTTLQLQLISIFNHWPKTILSFTRGRHLCNFHSPGGAIFSTVIRQGAPLKFIFSVFKMSPPKSPNFDIGSR